MAARQHGVVSGRQLLEIGLSAKGIRHRVTTGRLHRVERGVYAVGRPELSARGRWMAAVLGAGDGAVLSHRSAAALWGIAPDTEAVEVTVPVSSGRRRPGVKVCRRRELAVGDVDNRDGIPVTSIVRTLVDMASRLDPGRVERMVNEADRLNLIDPSGLREGLERYRGQRGVGRLRALLDRRTFRLTDSELERRFLPLAASAGLAYPLTRQRVNGYRVDFYWPELGLIVETDGLRYHRTPGQQARDRQRDQAHVVAGMTPLRFTHAQVRFAPQHVRATLTAVARRLERERSRRGPAA